METEAQAVHRAISNLHERRIFKSGDRDIEVRTLIPVASWRPLTVEWWTKKEACAIGENSAGCPLLRVCDGTVRIWDRGKQADEVLASSVREFLWALSKPILEEQKPVR
jgi:hypothetical protein